MKIALLLILLLTGLLSDVFYYSHGKKIKLTELKQLRDLNRSIRYYENEAGQKIGVTQEVIAKCKVDNLCKEIFSKYNLSHISNLTSTIMLITLDKNQDPFDISQKLSQEENIQFAHPNFIKKKRTR